MEFSYEIKIPKMRTAVLIGKKGEIKKRLKQETGTDVIIDSAEGIVTVSGDDAISLMDAQNIIKAIARGFNPEIAFLLLKPDYAFEIIDLGSIARNKNDLIRLRGRVIGFKGKSRKTIEDLTETNISVFGKTICIIGEISNVNNCKRAISQLIKGGKHANVFKFLEKQKKMNLFSEENF